MSYCQGCSFKCIASDCECKCHPVRCLGCAKYIRDGEAVVKTKKGDIFHGECVE